MDITVIKDTKDIRRERENGAFPGKKNKLFFALSGARKKFISDTICMKVRNREFAE